MTQVNGTSGTSDERPTLVSRELVWDQGAIVKIKVPTGAMRSSFEGQNAKGEGVKIKYFVFDQTVKNGSVRCHVHLRGEDTPELRGKSIVAKAQVWKKTFSNGRQYLYIDFHPVEKNVEVTHRLGVLPQASEVTPVKGWTIFETPRPMQGAIVFAPPDAKLSLSQHDKAEAFLAGLRACVPEELQAQLRVEEAQKAAGAQSPAEALAGRWGAKVTKKK